VTTVLLTGYGPFGHTPVNPAETVARALDGTHLGGATVTGVVVPNVFFKVLEVVQAKIAELRPQLVIMMGEFGGRPEITVERIAQNLNDGARYRLADNDGVILQDQLTAPDGPAAYYATLPIRAMVTAMRKAGIPADISDAAGTFGCNHLMYGILHHIAVHRLPIRAGWVHLPHLPEVAARDENLGAPSMSADTAIAGLRAGIQAAVDHPEDIREPVLSRWQF
jgi:pyroglutamyl-peptidase